MKIKINNKRVLFEGGRIICNDSTLTVDNLKCMVNNYISIAEKIKNVRTIEFNQNKFNSSICFILFDMPCTVNKLFELYNEIAEKTGELQFSKLWHNPSKSIKICPS